MTVQAPSAATPFGDAVRVQGGTVTVANERALHGAGMDALVREAVFGAEDVRERARWLIWEIGQAVGVRPASIHDLYLARGRGVTKGFTVPAINVRGASYDTARAIFRTAVKKKAGAFLLEILLTAAFVLTILLVTDRAANTVTAGIAIGFALAVVHIVGIPLDGTSVKPLTSPSQEWVRMRLPSAGSSIAYSLRAFA